MVFGTFDITSLVDNKLSILLRFSGKLSRKFF